MLSEDELWKAIRTRVRNAGLEIITFEELEPELGQNKILQKAKDALANEDLQGVFQNLRRFLSYDLIESLMRERGYGFVTNVSMFKFIEDQLNDCKWLKRECGEDICIVEIALDKNGRQIDGVGVYSRDPKYLRPRKDKTVSYPPRNTSYIDYCYTNAGSQAFKHLREYYDGKHEAENGCVDGTCTE